MSQNADGFMKIWAKDVAPFLDSKTGAFNPTVSGDILVTTDKQVINQPPNSKKIKLDSLDMKRLNPATKVSIFYSLSKLLFGFVF